MVSPVSHGDDLALGQRLADGPAARRGSVQAYRDGFTPCQPLQTYRGLPAYAVLQHAADQLPDRCAIIHGQSRWNYQEINEASIRAAATLQRLGVRPGDRVGILLPNVPEYVVGINAIWRAGAIAVAISPLMVEDEIHGLLEHTDCRFLICLDLLTPLVQVRDTGNKKRTTLLVTLRDKLPTHQQLGYWLKLGVQRLCHPLSSSNHFVGDFWTEVENTDQSWSPPRLNCNRDPAFILATGGTTAHPKAVTLSHQNLVANAWQQSVWINGSFGTQSMLAVLPYFHSYGMSATLLGSSMLGATSILHHRFSTKKVLGLIAEHQPTVMHAVPAMLAAMNTQLKKKRVDVSSLKWVVSGGAPLDEAVAREFSDHSGALVVEGYGLSEASPVTHVGHLFREARYGVIGLPLPETACRIVDPDNSDKDVRPGQVGELLVRGPQVMLGYWNDRAATRRAIRNGWLHTGDLAVKHPDGYYSIVGRIKDLIITSGFNVYPSDVEAVLCECPLVKEAAVVGDEDEQRGEVVHAYIVLERGATWDENSLDLYCRKHLSAHKRPRRFTHYQQDLPRNFLGKILRRQLRKEQEEEEEES